jgi:glucose/arabinose dehydrogenase
VIVTGFPDQRQHADKPIAFDDAGGLYVNVGAPSNACQVQTRTRGSPGRDPCPQRQRHAGIWRFEDAKPGQTQAEGERYATGIRQCVAMAWNREADALFAVQHGRDQLHSLWPEHFTVEDNARLPAEEFLLVERGSDFGWPYGYWDPFQEKRVLAPEYGGDGEKVGRCGQFDEPLLAFPAHWAPNDLMFYTGTQFPLRYRGGAFIAFHGSWNRAPLPQAGFTVVFVPFADGRPTGEWEIFADGFAGREVVARPSDARCRPMGLAQAPDGALLVSDSQRGRIWRVVSERPPDPNRGGDAP